MDGKLSILHVNATEVGGGAAVACNRLHKALISNGYDSQILVLKKYDQDDSIISISVGSYQFNLLKRKIASLILKLQRNSNPISHSLGFFSTEALKVINNSDADVIHLHWINGEMLSISDINKIRKKIIWSLHDSWVFCGTEHHPDVLNNDNRFIIGYNKNNRLNSSRGLDLDKLIWHLKRLHWKSLNVYFTVPSKWEFEMFKSSKLLGHMPCKVIPNLIDTNIFKPIDKNFAKGLFGIKTNKKILIFGAAKDPDKDKNKGFGLLLESMQKLSTIINPDSIHIIVFGTKNKIFSDNFPFSYSCVGSIRDESSMALIYNCGNVLLTPSLVESFGYTSLEAISCGTPVVAFDTSGLRDIILHKTNGYLAKSYDIDDFVEGIIYLLENENKLSSMCRKSVIERFSIDVTLQKYLDLYEDITKKI